MAKVVEITPEAAAEPKGAREKRWEAHLAAYEKQNPVKFAAKKKAGQFDEIPATFK